MATTNHENTLPATTLTPRVVVDAALGLAEAQGIAAVTIRRLAKELGVTPMAIYWHFHNKNALLEGMVDRVFEQVDTAVEVELPWQEQLRALLTSLVDALRTHAAVASLVTASAGISEHRLNATEAILDILQRGGFSPADATQVGRYVVSTLSNLVQDLPRGVDDGTSDDLVDTQRRAQALLETLSQERYPRIIEAAGPLSACEDPDGYFDFGLDLLLSGIEAKAS